MKREGERQALQGRRVHISIRQQQQYSFFRPIISKKGAHKNIIKISIVLFYKEKIKNVRDKRKESLINYTHTQKKVEMIYDQS